MHAIATVSDKGQVTLSKPLRDALGIQPGTRLEFRIVKGGALQVQVLTSGSSGLAGLLSKPGERARTVEEMNEAVAATVVGRAKRNP